MVKALKITLKIINTIIVVATVTLAVLVIGTKLLGIQMYTVLSGSMEPEYPTGSLIFVKEVEPSELEINDVITFRLGANTVATHRITKIISDENDPDSLEFRTKGDANEIEDAVPVSAKNVIGKPFFMIPGAGDFMNYVQNPPGRNVAIAVAAALLLFVFVTDIIIGEKKVKITDDNSKNNIKESCGHEETN